MSGKCDFDVKITSSAKLWNNYRNFQYKSLGARNFSPTWWGTNFLVVKYSSLRGFWPLGNNNRSIFIWGFLKDDILACVETWDLVIELWYLGAFWLLLEDFFWRLYFCMVKYLNFYDSSFALRYFFNVNGKATMWHTPYLFITLVDAMYLFDSKWVYIYVCET